MIFNSTECIDCKDTAKVGVKHQLINQSITQTYQKQVLKVEQCIDLITLFNIYTVVGTMYWDKIKLSHDFHLNVGHVCPVLEITSCIQHSGFYYNFHIHVISR